MGPGTEFMEKLKRGFRDWARGSDGNTNPPDNRLEDPSSSAAATDGPRHQPGTNPSREPSPGTDHSIATATDSNPLPQPFPVRTRVSGKPIRELWNTAYEKLREEDADLITDYEARLCGSLTAGFDSILGPKANRRDRMAAILKYKMDEVNRDVWKLKFGSSEVQVKEVVGPVLSIVNSANEYITDATSSNPYLSIAWAGVSLLLPLLTNPAEQDATLAKGLGHISTIIVRSRIWEDLYFRRYESTAGQHELSLPSHTEYKEVLEKLYFHILKFQAKAHCYYSQSTALRLGRDMIKWDGWDELFNGVEDQIRILTALHDDWRDKKYDEECVRLETRHQESTHSLQAIGADLTGLRNAVEQARADAERRRLLEWLCDSDHTALYNAARDLHEGGTGDWLVKDSEEFKTWKESSEGSLLWLHGKAGAGKSVLSSSVIQHLKDEYAAEPDAAIAYFFFSFSDSKKQSLSVMLASLVRQLCASRPDTPLPVKRLGQYKDGGGRPDTKTLETALLATTRGFSAVFVVIDALDECPTLGKERAKLLDSLGRITSPMPGNLHIICTSRPELDIKTAMDAFLSRSHGAAINLTTDQSKHNGDIGLYIDTMLASADYNSWPPDLKADAKDLLLKKADGMFLYVSRQLEALRDLASESAIRAALQNIPPGLDETYDRILQSLNKNYRPQIISALKWLASSNAELQLKQLAEIFILRPECAIPVNDAERLFEPEAFLKYVSGLVACNSYDQETYVRLAHFSVKEYLTSARTAADPGKRFYSFSEIEAHLHIAHSCLSYHLYYSTLTNDESWRLCLGGYAARQWACHLEMVPREDWPAEVINAAARALGIQSNSLRLSIEKLWLYLKGELEDNLRSMLQRPQCFTAQLGFFQLTNMLLCESTGISKYLTQEDLDAALPDAAYGGSKAVVQLLLDMGALVNYEHEEFGSALCTAAKGGHVEIVELLLGRGADINAHNGERSALQAAVSHHHLDLVRLLVSRGADLNWSATNEAESILVYAVQDGDGSHPTRMLEFLLESGVDINGGGGIRGTALHAAASDFDNCEANFRLLLDRGADVNMPGGRYGNPLQAFVSGFTAGAVELLLDKGADVNAEGGEFGGALQAACVKLFGDFRRIKLLVERGADVNARGGKYETALQAACANYTNSKDIIPYLLEKGAKVDIQGGKYGNALQAACRHQREWGTIELLITRGADVNTVGGKHGSALSAAARRLRPNSIPESLLRQGADVNAKGGEYGTALQAACLTGHVELVRLLIDRGADVQARGGRFGSAWHAAAAAAGGYENDSREVMGLLLDRGGCDVNDTGGGRYGTALQVALEFGYDEDWSLDKMRFLLDHGADANLGAGKYGTPLQSACAKRRLESAKLLLERCPGINVNAQGGKFCSALQAAVHTGMPELVELLLARGADVNARGGVYGSALNAAVVRGFWPFAEMLLEHGAEPQLPELGDEWLAGMQKKYGRGVSERLDKFREVHGQA
ncbi:hypothetical protein RB597_002768 [Gaeumannomyces tritici]